MYKNGDQSNRYQIEHFEIYRTLARVNDQYILNYTPRAVENPYEIIIYILIGVASAVGVVGIGFWYYRKTTRSSKAN